MPINILQNYFVPTFHIYTYLLLKIRTDFVMRVNTRQNSSLNVDLGTLHKFTTQVIQFQQEFGVNATLI